MKIIKKIINLIGAFFQKSAPEKVDVFITKNRAGRWIVGIPYYGAYAEYEESAPFEDYAAAFNCAVNLNGFNVITIEEYKQKLEDKNHG